MLKWFLVCETLLYSGNVRVSVPLGPQVAMHFCELLPVANGTRMVCMTMTAGENKFELRYYVELFDNVPDQGSQLSQGW